MKTYTARPGKFYNPYQSQSYRYEIVYSNWRSNVQFKRLVSSFLVLVTWALYLIIQVPEFANCDKNTNISVCYFCDTEVDFSVRNLICCSLTSRCCGPDRI